MALAKRFPRDEDECLERMLAACKRQRMAEASQYAYKRGGTLVTGPSIRLAEMMAQQWGNIDFGIEELQQGNGESVVRAYAHDLQTNARQRKTFTVPHLRHTKNGVTKLTDPRDIYEMIANQGARRLRACILGIIPQDIQDECLDACNKTLAGTSDSSTLGERVVKMVAAFGDHGVKMEQIEQRLGHNIDATTEPELVKLRQIYASIKDGMSKVADWFEVPKVTTSNLDDMFKDESDEASA